jgi:hypothetical protein
MVGISIGGEGLLSAARAFAVRDQAAVGDSYPAAQMAHLDSES